MNTRTAWFAMWLCDCTTLTTHRHEIPFECPEHAGFELMDAPSFTRLGDGAVLGRQSRTEAVELARVWGR